MLELKSPMCRTIFSSLAANDKSPRVKTIASGGLSSLGFETPATFLYCVRAAREPRLVMERALGGRIKVTDKQVYFLQSLAATALGEFKHPQALDVVGELLKSSDPGVKVASAACILKAIPQLSAFEPIAKKKNISLELKPTAKPAPRRPKLHTAGAKD
jgi:hypothetical protein